MMASDLRLTREQLLNRLRDIAGDEAVSSDDPALDAFATDALGSQRGFADGQQPAEPLAVVSPDSTEQVAGVLRLANRERISIVPYGGGTGLMGGARILRPGIVLDLGRMERVRSVQPADGWMWVEAGVRIERADAAAREHGYIVGHDPWTFAIATVGGAVSTNGLGFAGGKYGSMGEQVLALEVVLSTGEIVRTRPAQPHSTGIDLNHLFIGGEGVFGVVTAAAIRIYPRPERRLLAGYRFGSFDDGFEAVQRVVATGLTPAVLDYGERTPPASAASWRQWEAEPPTLYLGFEGASEEVDAQMARAAAICAQTGTGIEQADVDSYWKSRHVPAERFAQTRAQRRRPQPVPDGDATAFDYVHVALPASEVVRYRRDALAIARERDVEVLESGIWVRPGLFSLLLLAARSSQGDAVRRMSGTVDACLRLAQDRGGSMEYCHGAGLRLAHLMDEEHGSGLDVMRAIKRALDPNGILNPGKLALDEPGA